MAIVPEDLWITKGAATQVLPNRRSWLRPVARVRDGVTTAAAERELSALLAQRAMEPEPLPDGVSRTTVRLSPVRAIPSDARSDFGTFLGLLLGAASLVLIIASVNVGTMLSARSVARHREMALRTALGARRGRLIRQLLTESILLYIAGGVAGAFVAIQLTQAVERVPVPIDANLQLEISPNATVFLFALGAALVTGLIFGLGPALTASRTDLTSRLRDDSAGSGRRRSRASNVLIAGQLAASLVLLVCASLFNRALSSGRTMDTGFDMNNVATLRLRSSQWGYGDDAIRAFQNELRERVRNVPGVDDASFTDRLPLTAASERGSFFITGRPPVLRPDGTPAGEQLSLARVDESFFRMLRMPMRAGRGFSAADAVDAPRVAVINETMAAQFWPTGNAVGQTFEFRDSLHTIVGVVRDARYQSLSDPIPPVVYVPLSQHWLADQVLMVRGDMGAANVGRVAAEQLALMAPEVPRPPVIPLRRASGIVLIPQQIAAFATGTMGLVGLLLATVGLYGIVAYSVGRRTREIGVRMAVGAREGDVLRMVVKEGLYLTIVGVCVGLVVSLAASRLLSAFLLSVNPLDPVTFMAVPSVFLVVALLASYFPARRAALLSPVSALRAE